MALSRGIAEQRLCCGFHQIADVSLEVSLGMVTLLLVVCLLMIRWIFKTGYRLKDYAMSGLHFIAESPAP